MKYLNLLRRFNGPSVVLLGTDSCLYTYTQNDENKNN